MKSIYKELKIEDILKTNGLAGVWSLMKGFRGQYISAVFFLAVASVSKTFSFILLKYFIDNVLAAGFHFENLYMYALGFIGIAVLEAFTSFLRGRLAASSSEGITLRLRNHLFNHIQRLSFTYHDNMQTGELLERVTSDVEKMRRFYAEQATEIGSIVTLFIFNLTAIVQLNLFLGIMSVVFLPLILFLSVYFFKKIFTAFDRYQDQEARLSSVLQENLSAMQIVRAFARKEYEIAKFEAENSEKFKRGRNLLLWHNYFWPVTDIICMMQTLLIIGMGGFMAITGTITPGTFIAITGLLSNIIWPMRNLGRIVIEASTTFVSYKRLAEIFREQTEIVNEQDVPHPVTGDVAFENVSFKYKDDSAVLREISFTCKQGEMIALLGTTGSGKTSLVNLLPRFYAHTGGSIYIDGRKIEEYPLYTLRSQIGIIEQEPFLFSASIRDNIRYGTRKIVTDEEITAAAQAAAIHDVILEFPDGYDTHVGEKGITLSGGQKQRLALARTLLKDPRILILDDATSSVDTVTEARIQKALSTLMKGRTCFVIAHRVQTIMHADKILVLDEGRIVQQGTHADLIKEEGLYKRIFQNQFEMDLTETEYTIEEILNG